METDRAHAIVLGGSLAGLLAARALSTHYRQVTLIERDTFPNTGEHRRGVPQGRHTHGLLAGGRVVLEEFFPGFTERLSEAGGVTGDITETTRWFIGGLLARFYGDLEGLLVSRPFLEGMVRELVLAISNMVARPGSEVRGLTHSAGRVTGVDVGGSTLAADLVVDATGRGSKSPQWLQSMGYEPPAEDRVEIALAYTTRLFRRLPSHLDGDLAAVFGLDPSKKRGGVMLAQEGDRWIVTLTGHFGNCAPMDLPGFIEYARSLPAPYIYDVIRDAEPMGEPASARFAASVRRRYERLQRFPEGYLVIGDAISSFNPVYGQGMTVAAMEARELDRVLRDASRGLAQRFFPRASALIDAPWNIAVGNDLRMPETVGRRTGFGKFLNWYMSKLHRAARFDPVPALAFHRVANLLDPPPAILAPRVAWRVLRGNLRRAPAETATLSIAQTTHRSAAASPQS